MQELITTIDKLLAEVNQVVVKLDINKKQKELDELKKQSSLPEFWQDNLAAQEVMKKISKLEQRIEPWQQIQNELKEAKDLAALGDD